MRKRYLYTMISIGILLSGCKSGDQEFTSEFIIHPGFEIECIASEPLVRVPVEMEMDADGNLWVVELTGYMRDIDGNEENKPDGKVVKLEDLDDDGIMDKRTVILDSLAAPRAICLINNGILYNDGKMLKWSDKDGHPDSHMVIDSHYVTGSNIEHQPNGLYYHIDNWVYSARSNTRYQFRNENWVKEITHFRGQWGISSDEAGRLIYNDNSNLIRGDALLPGMVLNNPYLEVNYSIGRLLTNVNRVIPLQPTSVNRGYQEGVLDEEGKLINATSTCGPVIYNGNAFPEQFAGDAFVCVPEINAIKHLDIREENGRVMATNDSTKMEFLVSKDETFRPVNLHNGPDGSLYVVDMRKGVIQHRAYMTDYLRENILSKNLEQVVGKGRIYRIKSVNQLESIPHNSLLEGLQSDNGYVRLTSQQNIIGENKVELEEELKAIAMDHSDFLPRIHALWTLEGLQLLDSNTLEEVISTAGHPTLISHILWLSDLIQIPQKLKDEFLEISSKIDDPFLDIFYAYFTAKWTNNLSEQLDDLPISKYRNDTLYSEALISGLVGIEKNFLSLHQSNYDSDTLSQMLKRTINAGEAEITHLPTGENIFYDSRTKGLEGYNLYCSSCHRMDGKGQKNLAPPLVNSYILGDDPQKTALVILQGLRGPIHAGGRRYNMNVMMPGLKSNSQLSDQDVADIVHFVRNAFVAQWTRLDSTGVKHLREMVDGRSDLFTEDELTEMCF